MNLNKIKESGIGVFGDAEFRGKCPTESAEQMTFFNKLRREFPETYGRIALHPRNEGKRTLEQADRQRAEGLTTGASDIIIPGSPAFCCELKRQDHTKCSLQPGQIDYLVAAKKCGAFVCVAFGYQAAWQAFIAWRNHAN